MRTRRAAPGDVFAQIAAEGKQQRDRLPEEPETLRQAVSIIEEIEALTMQLRGKFNAVDSLISGVYARQQYDRRIPVLGLQDLLWGTASANRTLPAVEAIEGLRDGLSDIVEARLEELEQI